MLQPNDFKIYNASAGTGKTYTLVKEFMSLLLSNPNPDAFSSVLAITFTNKAANEMKQRIVEALYEFTGDNFKSQTALQELSQELDLPIETLHERAKVILSAILHKYSQFTVSTIDKFNLRLMRSFSQDLGLSSNFEVEMDVQTLLGESVDVLFSQLGENENLTRILSEIALDNLQSDKAWDVSGELTKSSMRMLKDQFLRYLEMLRKVSLEDLDTFRKSVNEKVHKDETYLQELAHSILEMIQSFGLNFDDFYYGNRGGLPSYFKKLQNKKFDFPTATSHKAIEEKKYISGKASLETESTIASIFPKLEEAFNQSITVLRHYHFWAKVKKTVKSLTIFNEVDKVLEDIKLENNILLISEFNTILSNNLKDQPSGFIYERLGTRFKHYFIDEFQDTSTLQWDNMSPLLENALAQGDTIMIVGDPKQSIYRFRGGNPQLMLDLMEEEKSGRIKVQQLDKNWRSHTEVIQFNNALYTHISEQLENDEYAKIYQEGNQQKNNDKQGGLVSLDLVDKNSSDELSFVELSLQILLKRINEAQSSGFSLDEMVVLTRTRKESAQVADYLTEKGIQIISDESLLIDNSQEVQALLRFIQWMFHPENPTFRTELVLTLSTLQIIPKEKINTILSQTVNAANTDFLSELFNYNIDFHFVNETGKTFYDQVESATRKLNLNQTGNIYVQYFLDEILTYQNQSDTSPSEFLDYWETVKEKKSVLLPEGTEAVRLMTIHKSKGLQFQVVMLPFVAWTAKPDGIWIPLENEKLNHFYIDNFKFSEKLDNEVKTLMDREVDESNFDALNLLYVATTRAVEQLYIITELLTGKKQDGTQVKHFLNQFVNNYEAKDNRLTFGSPERTEKKKESSKMVKESIDFVSSNWAEKVRLSSPHLLAWDEEKTQAIDFGDKLHAVMAKIKIWSDKEKVLDDFYAWGILSDSELKNITQIMDGLQNESLLQKYFKENTEIILEREFVDSEGKIFRPDRMVKIGEEWGIIDYKTGSEENKHVHQIQKYAQSLTELGYNISEKLLVYATDNKMLIKTIS